MTKFLVFANILLALILTLLLLWASPEAGAQSTPDPTPTCWEQPDGSIWCVVAPVGPQPTPTATPMATPAYTPMPRPTPQHTVYLALVAK
jgi:hypothetical protein